MSRVVISQVTIRGIGSGSGSGFLKNHIIIGIRSNMS